MVTYNWTRDEDGGYTVTAKAICKNDPTDEITETVKAVKEVLYEPAADEPGLARYTVTFGNEILGTKTREELIPELDYDVPVYEWIETDDGFAVKATVACLDDPSKSITETVPAAYEVISPAKCESDGKGIYTVAFESGLLSDQTKEVTIPATGHSWSGPEWKWTDDGSAAKATFTCANDGETTDSTAAVTAEKKSGNMVYTATVTGPDGKTYTEIKTVPVANDDILRIFGSTRYLTAFKNADKLKEELGISKFSTVVVATGMNFPDSLSGAYLANVKDAPILLISEKEAANVRSYISANLEKGGTIYILGGEGVVKDSWLSGLGSFHKKRLAGSTRYETNLEVLKEVGYNGGDILIATGLNYPDSLAGSSVAMPILLVKGNTLMPEQTAYLKGLGGKLNCYIAGGTGAVSAEMEKTLRANGTIARRFAGTDRYETSRMIAEEFFAKSDMAILAVGSNFPDGLSVGPLAAKVNAPILLTNNGAKSESSQAFTDSHGIKSGIVIGGPALISDEVAKSVLHNNTIVLYEN